MFYVRLWDKASCTPEQFLMLGYLTSLVLGREPKTQVAGISVMVDLDGLSWKHVPSIKNLSTYLKLLSVSSFNNCQLCDFAQPTYFDNIVFL